MKLRLAVKISGRLEKTKSFATMRAAQDRVSLAQNRGLGRGKLTPWQRHRKKMRMPY